MACCQPGIPVRKRRLSGTGICGFKESGHSLRVHTDAQGRGSGSLSVGTMIERTRPGRSRSCRSAIIPLLAALMALSPASERLVAPAQAEERPRRTLMDMLFGPRQKEPMMAPVEPPPVRKRRPPAQPPQQQTARPPAPPPVEKAEDAARILVVGDFLAGGLGEGLAAAFTETPDIAIVTRQSGSSGLVRTDYYDWLSELPRMLDEVKPVAVVLMIGSNDRQQMAIGQIREKYGTEAWIEEYRKRISALTAVVTSRKLPLLWVGLPSFQSPSMSADVAALNRYFHAEAEKNGSEFIDIWDGFADETGRFIATGSDINGQQVRLRGSDGINLTTAGKRKLAFYTEKFLRRHLDSATITSLIRLDSSNLPALSGIPEPQAGIITRTLPVSITDPELDGSSVLLGSERPSPVPIVETPRDMLVRRGHLPSPPGGRIDSDAPLTP